MASDKLRDQEQPKVFGYDLDPDSLTPVRKAVNVHGEGDHGADPVGDGTYRMVPSGDIVDLDEKRRRLSKYNSR